MTAPLLRRTLAILSLLALPCLLPAHAGEHGGGGGGPAPLSFVVNLMSAGGGDRYVRIDFVLEAASPEVEHAIKTFLPKIQHNVILLLSGMRDEVLRTAAGKHELADDIRRAANKILDENEKTGVKDVLFTNFLIQ